MFKLHFDLHYLELRVDLGIIAWDLSVEFPLL